MRPPHAPLVPWLSLMQIQTSRLRGSPTKGPARRLVVASGFAPLALLSLTEKKGLSRRGH
jgi:hypothetical protein